MPRIWTCRKPRALTTQEAAATKALTIDLAGLRWTSADPLHFIGNEIREGLRLAQRLQRQSEHSKAAIAKCRSLVLRPAIEAPLLAHWSALETRNISKAGLQQIVSLTRGQSATWRRGEANGRHQSGEDVHFPSQNGEEFVSYCHEVFSRNAESNIGCYLYASAIVTHPFDDGNGRLARMMFASQTANGLEWFTSRLPLAPYLYLNERALTRGLQAFVDDNDLLPIISALHRTVVQSIKAMVLAGEVRMTKLGLD